MCGIIGRKNSRLPVDPALFARMRDTMIHRGPDGAGIHISPDGFSALGHRRLSFLDLSDNGKQPMQNETADVFLTINGEIYNYQELRAELSSKGHRFVSSSDSEVVLHGYEEWGTNVVSRLFGMFAFGILDQRNNSIFIARDRFGIKPLYYFHSAETFIFSSEIKGIVADNTVPREIDLSSFSDFFTYRYIPSPKTIWKNICKLPPAHSLLLDSRGQIKISEYWIPEFGNEQPDDTEMTGHIDDFLLASVKGHILSDVPVGSFLSGGYDSSAIVYYMNRLNYPVRSFAIGFRGWDKSEHHYAELVAARFGTDHHSLIIDSEALGLLDTLVWHYDEPIADISIVPTYEVSGLAHMHVKAVLSGEGADELFGGYTWHREFYEAHLKTSRLQRWLRNSGLASNSFGISHYSCAMAMGMFDAGMRDKVLHPGLLHEIEEDPFWFYRKHYKPQAGIVKSFQYLDIKTFMGELVLTKIDRASMAHSLEVRVPFLDHRLTEYIMGIDEKKYFRPPCKKYLLYQNIRNVMPEAILERNKQVIVGPDSYYMDIDWYKNQLRDSELVKNNLIQKKGIDMLTETRDHWRLWKITVMERWYRCWVTNMNSHK